MKKIFLNISFLIFGLFAFAICNSIAQATDPESEIQTIEQNELEAQNLSLQWNRQSIEKAIEIYLEISHKWENLNRKDRIVKCLRETGKLYVLLGDKQKASGIFEKALKIIEKDNFIDEQIRLCGELSLVRYDLGNIDESKKFLEKGLLLAGQTQNDSVKGAIFFSAGEIHFFQDELKEALKYYQQSLNLFGKVNDLRGEALTLVSFGYLYLQQNDYNSSLNAFDLALAKWQKLNDLRGQATTLKAIGTNLSDLNDKQKALEVYSQAEKLFPNNIDYTEKGVLYNGISSIYEYYQDWKQSILFREKALELLEKDNYAYGQLATLTALGRLHFLIGNRDLALKYLTNSENKAIEIKNDYYLAIIKEQVGRIYFEQGDYPKAALFFQKSLSLLQKNQFNARQISRVLNNLGQLYFQKTQYAIARKYYFSSLGFNQKVRDKFAQAETVFRLAQLDALENKDKDALKLAEESIQITDLLSSDVLNSKLKSAYFSNVYDRYKLYINLLMKMHKQSPNENYAIQALQASEKSRARSLLETLRLSEANFTKDADPELVQKEKEIRTLLNLKADKLTELLNSNAEKAETDKLDNEINSLQNELEDIKGKLKANSPIYSAIKNPSAFDVQDFQANVLDDKTLLLEFSFGVEESYLWLVSKNEVSYFTLPKREILDSRIQKLLDLLKAREISEGEDPESYQKRLIDAEKEYESEARLLSNELFEQIADKLTDKRLIIVPDGKLYYFPISALPLPNVANNTPMLETNEIVYEPSAATLQILGKTPRPEKLPKELLVFADPIFSLQDNRLSAENKNPTVENDAAFLGSSLRSFNLTDSNNQLSRLFATQEEAESIAKIVGASNSTIVSGFAANRQRVFEKDISDYKIIHFATHGLMNDTRPELSGVVLSQFDEKGEAQKGFIRLQDIYSLNLSADLVVLSACQSGIGKEVKGEGLMSLTGGFIQSGANSVLSSLWKVDDYATAELMKNFYQELSTKNLAPSQALRNAQIKMRQNPNFKSPFYWAAFTVQGEFRHPISVNTNRFSYLWIVLTAIFVGLVIYFVLKFYKRSELRLEANGIGVKNQK